MERTGKQVVLDVRPDLKKKLEPYQKIMDAVSSLEKDDLFVLHTTFKPTPLLGVMKLKGFGHRLEQISEEHWITAFACGGVDKELTLAELAQTEEEAAQHEQ